MSIRYLTEVSPKVNVLYWDGDNIVAEQLDQGELKTYLRGHDLIAKNQSGMVYYVQDEHGSISHVVNASGTSKVTYEYDAFGTERNLKKEDDNRFRYSGEYLDFETNTYYLRARSYRATTGRFLTEDPVNAGLNWYIYCDNNPTKYVDPSGLVKVLLNYINKPEKANFEYVLQEHIKNKWYGSSSYYTIDITIGDKSVSYEANEIGGELVIESDDLVRDFGLDRNLAEHQIGDKFNSVDDTALAWSLKYYDISNKKDDKHEYGSAIYEVDGKYAFSKPNIGTFSSVYIPSAPQGYTRVAGIHTHPYTFGYDNNNFSGSKWYHKDNKNGGDYKWINQNQITLYLAAPDYLIKAADYINGEINQRTLSNKIKSYKG